MVFNQSKVVSRVSLEDTKISTEEMQYRWLKPANNITIK
ncbi:hypothetical protein P20495_1905 [Pseudoalteromonas sp. BSi20495]|nr:hypothetical protein P20495_1905 [Pseudoalteromonas sp. BSi20495]